MSQASATQRAAAPRKSSPPRRAQTAPSADSAGSAAAPPDQADGEAARRPDAAHREPVPGGATDRPPSTDLLAARDRGRRALEAHDAQRLLATRRRALQQVDAELAAVDDRIVLDELVTAGRELLRSLETLNDDEEFWDDLTAVERRVDRSSRADLLRLREVLDHDLLGILPALGYRPPPSELEFADAVQDTLAALLGPPRPERGDARRVERAHQELSWFLIRFRRLLDDRACSASARTAGPEERASARVRVAAWLRRAVSAAVPAAVAAGTLGAIMGPQAGVAAGLAAGSSEALKQLVQVGAADAMGRVLGAEGLPQPEGLAADLESAVDTAVQRVAGVAHRPPGDPVREGAVFLLRRALYRVLQAGPEVDGVAPLQGWCEEAVRLLRSAPLEQVVGYWRHGDQAVPPPSPAAVPPRPTGTFVW